MRLASLTPEVRRLRRIAQACAAGELSRSDYRSARRRVIEQMMLASDAEDTTPRFDGDTTVRRDAVIPVAPAEPSRKHAWWWLLLLLGICYTAVAVAEPVVIPPLKERTSSVMREPIAVQSLSWRVPDDLTLISQVQVDGFLDEALAQVGNHDLPLSHGFTQAELQQIGHFLNAIGVHERDALNIEDARDLKALIENQVARRGATLTDLTAIAEQLQIWLREQGYPLARAYVPSQRVAAGDVSLGVEIGILSSVVAQAVETQTPQQHRVSKRFRSLLGRPVSRADLETRLNLINRSSAVAVQAGFQPGHAVGETEMVLHLTQGNATRLVVQADNHGLEQIGEERIAVAVQQHDLLRGGDWLRSELVSAVGGEDQILGSIAYHMPFEGTDRALFTSLRRADLSVQGESVTLEGTGTLIEVGLLDTHQFTRRQRLESRYRAGWHDIDWGSGNLAQSSWYVGAGIEGHHLWDHTRWALSAETELVVGSVDEPASYQSEEFALLRFGALAWTPLTILRPLLDQAKLSIHTRGQYTGGGLTATHQFELATPQYNHGLPMGYARADRAIEVGSRIRWQVLGGEGSLGVDMSFGERETAASPYAWYQLTTFAAGWRYYHGLRRGGITTELRTGYPLVHKSNDVLDDDGLQLLWSVRFEH